MTVAKIGKPSLVLLLFLPILLSVQLGIGRADRRYVSDRLIITLRETPNTNGRVLRTLKTDTPVEVLEESGRYLRIRTEAGEEGWVDKQYITPETPKPIIMARLHDEMNRLQEKIK